MEKHEIQWIRSGGLAVARTADTKPAPSASLARFGALGLLFGAFVLCCCLSGAAQAQDGIASHVADLGSVEDDVRVAAHDALVQAGPSAIPALIEGLDDPNSLVRWGASRVLGELGSSDASAALAERLRDSNEYTHVQRAAAVALGRCGGEGAPEALRAYLEEDPTIGAEALGLLGETVFLPELLNFLLDLERDYASLKLLRGSDRELVRSREPQIVGSIAVVSAAVCRLGCRGGVPPLIDSTKFTEWIGMYARSVFREYLGEDMPSILPGSKRNENIDTLQVHSAIARFFDEGIDTYIHPAELEAPAPELVEKCRRIVDVIDEGSPEAVERRIDVLAAIGKPIIPLLVGEYSNPSSPAYLSDSIIESLYLMGGSLRVARTPRLTRRVFDDLSRLIPEIGDVAAKAGLVRLVGEFLHWWPYEQEIRNYSSAFSEEVFASIIEIRDEGKEFLFLMIESGEKEVKVAALESLIKIGDEELADVAGNAFTAADNDEVRIAAIRALEWIKYESGRAMLEVLDIIEGDFSDDVRLAAAESLAKIEDPTRGPLSGLPALLEYLSSDNPEYRARAALALRIATDRYFGFVADAPEAQRAKAVARWTKWFDENLDSFRPDIFRIRKRQFDYHNWTLRQLNDMRTDLRRFEQAPATPKAIREFKSFYRHQFRFLPFLMDRYDDIDEALHPMVSNLIASRFDKPEGLPFLVRLLESRADIDAIVVINALDTIGAFPEYGLLDDEKQALIEPVAEVLADESMRNIVRVTAAGTLASLGDLRGVDLLIANLTLKDSVENAGWLRDESFDILRRVARSAGHRGDFGYEPNAPAIVREEAGRAWKEWWDSKGN